MTKQKNGNYNGNFSKNLEEIRNICVAISRDRTIRVKYDGELPTSAFNMENNEITLSLTPYPDFVKNNERIAKKILDGDSVHEVGHKMLTKPLWEFFNSWVTNIKRKRGYYKLASEIANVIEDKRINHFIILRYRFDVGKRLLLANLILKDMIDNTLEPKIIKGKATQTMQIQSGFPEGVYMFGILVNKGLYDAKCTPLYAQLKTKEAKEDMEKALQILEDVKYKRLRIDIIRACNDIYELIAKHLNEDFIRKDYVCSRRGGKLKGEISQKLKELLEKEVKEEEEKEKDHLKDLLKGSGAGEGFGYEIPSPEPNFVEYSRLVDKNKSEITELLNKLKRLIRPKCSREIFRKRGKMMAPIIPKIYSNSFRGTVKNVYTNVKTKFEKEQVCIHFLFDFSGSVDREEATDITTILNEVCGHWIDDMGFAISCFGADSQKIKTPFETFFNTRARIGNIGVNAFGTEICVLLNAHLKMFNAVRDERRKILVIASDFEWSDEDEAVELLETYVKCGIEIIFIGFCNCKKVYKVANHIKGIKRSHIRNVHELPAKFLDVYLDLQSGIKIWEN